MRYLYDVIFDDDMVQIEDLQNNFYNISSERFDTLDVYIVPVTSTPIEIDLCDKRRVQTFMDNYQKLQGRKFDILLCDPPWTLATADPTRGPALHYSQLPSTEIFKLDLRMFQDEGHVFLWVINSVYDDAIKWLTKLDYEIVQQIVWIKSTVNGKLSPSTGHYAMHAKETCLVARKGNCKCAKLQNVIISSRGRQSQKPLQLYKMIEEKFPEATCVELFGRYNNLRHNWFTLGLEVYPGGGNLCNLGKEQRYNIEKKYFVVA